ncbi:MAG TPA: hypothetical protein VHA06_01430, partial [Candidatus Angelobacter sp.]|nr:hypothetical protein [Candidatus Angelobacter sp.]
KVLLSAFLCLFAAQLLGAQTIASPHVAACPIQPPAPEFASASPAVAACPTPTPTPIPPQPTPTPVDGVIGPKFIILTVTYAPPGSASSVTYSNSSMLGTSTSVSNSFTNDVNVNASISSGFSIFGFGVNFTATASTDLSQETDSSSSIAVNETTNSSTQVRGPSNSALGVDHDEDIVWVWLNPVIHLVANSDTSFTWTGYGFDLNDPTGNTDILGIPAKYLNGHAAMPANIADVLARRWAPPIACTSADPNCGTNGTEAPGLTAADLAAILAADPFSNPSYVVNVPNGASCTVDGRFCRTTNQNLQYSPPPPGGQPTTQAFSMVHQTTATQGQGASSTYKVGFSSQFTAKAGFIAKIMAKLTTADTLSWMSKWSSLNTQQVGQTAALSVTGPTVADNYTGPVEFEVFQDNIYGTFMFGFVPEPTFTLSAGAASQNAVQGGVCSSYTASIAALVSGFASTVNLGVTGLPANATATFSPASVTGAGSSTLTVCAPSTATPIGTSTLTINATSGIEIHSTTVSLTVVAPPPPPNFTISATPSFQSIIRGNSAFYTVSTAAISGFAGTEALTVSGMPAGVTAHFTAASIATGGSTTLTVTSSTTTVPGTYTLTITGTSASPSLAHSTSVSLTITSAPTGGCPPVINAQPSGTAGTNVAQCPITPL